MIISMAWTTSAYLARRKTCTRRMWSDKHLAQWQRAYDKGRLHHDVYDHSPRNGGRQIGRLRLTARPCRQKLADMPESDLEAEGGLWSSLDEFIELFGGAHLEPALVRFEPLPFSSKNAKNESGGKSRSGKRAVRNASRRNSKALPKPCPR